MVNTNYWKPLAGRLVVYARISDVNLEMSFFYRGTDVLNDPHDDRFPCKMIARIDKYRAGPQFHTTWKSELAGQSSTYDGIAITYQHYRTQDELTLIRRLWNTSKTVPVTFDAWLQEVLDLDDLLEEEKILLCQASGCSRQ